MSRTLKVEHETTQSHIIKALADNQIQFQHQRLDESIQLFAFPERNLTLTLKAYDPIHGSSGQPGKLSTHGMPLSGSLAIFKTLNANNLPLAEKIVASVDDLIK